MIWNQERPMGATAGKRLTGILGAFVGTVFAIAAAGIVWLLATFFLNHHAARNWVSVPAEVADAEIKSSRSTGISPARTTISSRVRTIYRYTYKGTEYTGHRVDFSFGSDNFSGSRRGRQMNILHGASPTVFVNPANPAESVLDRSLPVEQINFAVIFLFFPCGIGTAMLFGWSAHLVSLIGWGVPSRFLVPTLGLVHTLPAFYAPLRAPAELGPFGWVIVLVAGVVFLISLRALWRRVKDPSIDAPKRDESVP
jgi:hypothetical protein